MDFTEYPILYYFALALTLGLLAEALLHTYRSWSRPAIALYLTIAAWYIGDMTYNGTEEFYSRFTSETINFAFIQVILFLVSYRFFLFIGSGLFREDHKPALPEYSISQEKTILMLVFAVWFVLNTIAIVRVEFDVWSLVFPPFSEQAMYPWGRNSVGVGGDFLVSFFEYTHMAVIGLMGVLVVLIRRPQYRIIAGASFLMGIQLYLFQWARNRMLAVILPAILAYLLLSPVKLWIKAIVATGLFFAISSWFLIIVTSRDRKEGEMIERLQAASEGDPTGKKRHHGLNMFEELCYHDVLISSGAYNPGIGERYFAELVAVIPRAIWPNKPFIGIDYAVARGLGGANTDIGVFATIATGMIGQGVTNFGPWFGPPFAAFLMAIWNWILARLWVERSNFARIGLFLLGMGLTYNLGRDITLLVLFPFVFSYIGVLILEKISPKKTVPKYSAKPIRV